MFHLPVLSSRFFLEDVYYIFLETDAKVTVENDEMLSPKMYKSCEQVNKLVSLNWLLLYLSVCWTVSAIKKK